ncbi:uncharacterized protein B0H18DRAFT_1011687 [Fomitopsis serialis]|uniref:uncharacterized protein n=1 Tax=Fomitopsis serialis TaxID=139415 RepID=UPI002008C76D|nr:uncharacterized protein B0H18DRAFT_1011687 [Neoantrodia serialis]KAH9924552.1 hypothetical protein B0H18DRAFT_1011687 [Neoantrodia serialis]
MDSKDQANDNVHEPNTTAKDLPADVLVGIFRDVAHTAQRPGYLDRTNTLRLNPWSSHDTTSCEHPFPECLASVSPLWRDAMSSISMFWTHIVIWIGRNPTPPSRIREYLEWSRGRLLDIHIVRRFDLTLDDATEKAQVDAIMALLLPHMGRWRVLGMKVLHSRSLPCPRVDLVGYADNLIRLNLDFLLDNLITSPDIDSPAVYEFYTPKLRDLSICGVHFRHAYVQNYEQSPMPPELLSLTITSYDERNVPFPLHELLACLVRTHNLREVELDGLSLDCYSDDSEGLLSTVLPDGFRWRTPMSFVNMSADVIAEFGSLLDGPTLGYLCYTRCTLPTRPPSPPELPEAFSVTLTDIASPGALLYYLTTGLDTSSVACCQAEIVRCDGLLPAVLRRLAVPMRTRADGTAEWLCAEVEHFIITECTKFRSTDLRAFVEARWHAASAAAHALDWDTEHPGIVAVSNLYVRDCGELAPEDREWLNEHVSIVCWDGWRGGYGDVAPLGP